MCLSSLLCWHSQCSCPEQLGLSSVTRRWSCCAAQMRRIALCHISLLLFFCFCCMAERLEGEEPLETLAPGQVERDRRYLLVSAQWQQQIGPVTHLRNSLTLALGVLKVVINYYCSIALSSAIAKQDGLIAQGILPANKAEFFPPSHVTGQGDQSF